MMALMSAPYLTCTAWQETGRWTGAKTVA